MPHMFDSLGVTKRQVAVGAAVLGVGCAIGFGTHLVYRRLQRKTSDFSSIRDELGTLKREVVVLREEIRNLKASNDYPDSIRQIKKQTSVARSGSLRSQSDDEFFDATEWLSGYGSDDENEPFNTLDLKTVYEKVDTLLQSTAEADRRAAYDIMSQIAHKHSDNVEFLWRFARTCHLYATCFAKVDEEKRKKFVFEGRDNAFKALKINDHNADVYKWCAATSGVSTDFLLLKEKIEQGYAFKTYVDRALEIRPDDNIVLHMRGRWSFSVAQLSWIERKVAATLFASPPNATVEDALADFLEAERFKPGEWIENLVYVAKCYLALNDQTSAIPYLRTALSGLEVTDPGDQAALEEARLLMKSIT